MTQYAIDEARGELMAVWETGYGAASTRVAPLPDSSSAGDRRALAAELSGLSEALWRCYTHPATAADSLDVNTEGWRRQQTRDGFGSVVDHIRRPNLPDDHGSLMVSYHPVEERAHRVGRCLHRVASADLISAVIMDVEAELDAVQRAELGDLSGRSVQAVQLTRQDASPVQVAAADQMLADDPLGTDELFLATRPDLGVCSRRALAAGGGGRRRGGVRDRGDHGRRGGGQHRGVAARDADRGPRTHGRGHVPN